MKLSASNLVAWISVKYTLIFSIFVCDFSINLQKAPYISVYPYTLFSTCIVKILYIIIEGHISVQILINQYSWRI